MKQITITRVGYNMPSQANWSYGVWLVSFVDTSKSYCISETVKESFGGDSRFSSMLETRTGHKTIEIKGIYTSTGTPKITGITKMQDMESPEFLKEVVEWLKEK